jgi:diguanylate cyclase (GGDEF)-like protein
MYIVLFDIDHFKRINDTYSHQASDQVLQTVAAACREHLRQMDVFGRYGGEEFIILLPELEIQHAQQAAEKIRALIAGQTIVFDDRSIAVTVSLGVAEFSDGEPLNQLLVRVDKALYQAKEGGRNQVRVG